jgi:basic amino acid/polyamine antiporter, APA family
MKLDYNPPSTRAIMTTLQRAIGLPSATALVVGTIIGSSIFVQASEITSLVPDATAVVLAWAVAGALTLIGALVCAELASAYPRTGGVYVYLKEIYSPLLGFVWGWATFWSMHTGILAAIATVFARYAAFFVPLDDTGLRIVAIGSILALSAVNYVGVRFGGGVQTAFTIVKVIAVGAIIILGWALSGEPPPAASAALAPITVTNFSLAVAAGLFAFGGWHMVTYTAEETINPTRTIPRSLMIGIAVVTVCYIGLNAIYLLVLPIEKVMTSTRVAADTFEVLVGTGGAGVISALVMFSAFGALNGIVMMGPRVYYQIAQDGLMFRWFNHLHPKFQTPDRAIILQAIWSSVLVATGSYRALFTRVIYTEWIFFALLAIGVVLLRRRPGYAPAWRMPLVPVAPIVFVVVSLLIVVNQIRADLTNSTIGLLIVASGIPAYYLLARNRASSNR